MSLREPHVQKGIAGILLAAVLAWLIFFTPYLPFSQKRTGKELSQLKQELQVVAGELQRTMAIAESMTKIQRELAQLEAKWNALRDLLPRATEMSNLLAEVTSSGMRAGTQFSLFEPLPPEPAELYTRYPIRVAITGGYHQVGSFLDNLCNMSRLVGISDVKVVQIDEGTKDVTVEATATVSAFTYNEESRKMEKPAETSKKSQEQKSKE